MQLMENQKVIFASKPENLVLVEKMIEDVCEEFKISEDQYGNMLVALTEAVNNAMQHGNKSDPSKKVTLGFEVMEDYIKFRVKDEGQGFDFTQTPDPTDPMNIEKPNGRGVFLMKRLSDFAEFKDNGRTVELKFKLTSELSLA